MKKPSTYKLRFFFDYNCGGCLWGDNDAAYQYFGFGCLDAETVDLNGGILERPKIELSKYLKQKVIHLNDLYAESLDWDNPSGDSLWTKAQWDDFFEKTKDLYWEIIEFLGEDYEVTYKQE